VIDIAAVLSSVWLLPMLALMVTADGPLPVLPSEALIMIATSSAMSRAATDALVALFLAITVASMAGDALNYGIGKWSRRMPAADLTAGGRVGRIRERLVRRPGAALVVARFIPGGRLVSTVGAGRAGVPFSLFVPWTVVSSSLWAVYMMSLGVGIGAMTLGNPWVSLAAAIVVSLGLGVAFEAGRRLWRRVRPAAVSGRQVPAGSPADVR
jgi:membrane protein DedA with SNARE-associated domain